MAKKAPASTAKTTPAKGTALEVGERAKPATPPSAPSRHLDVFPNPAPQRDYVIQFQVPEFTCFCPLTGQPDFAHFTIDCIADELCIELKSLKKRWKEPSFAKGARREDMMTCSELGLELEEFLAIGLDAMREVADDLGL